MSRSKGLQLKWVVLGFSVLFLSVPPSVRAAQLSCAALPQLFKLYLRYHYVHRKLTDEIKEHTVDQFVKGLDPAKTLLYESDVKKIKKDLLTVFATMDQGDCKKIDLLQPLILERAQKNEEIAKAYLGDQYQLDEKAELVTDPDKRGYSKSESEKKILIEKMIHFQISNYLLTKTALPEAKKNVIHSYELVTKRVGEKTSYRFYNDFAGAFALALDPHSSYMSADEVAEFNIQMQLSLEGIGASLSSQDGFTVIEEVIPGGAAEKLNILKAKDKIIAVGQENEKPISVIDMDLSDVVKKIRGKKGTKVTLTILRQSKGSETFSVTIVRDKIDIKESAAKITYEEKKIGGQKFKIGVIDFPSFYGGGNEGRSSYKDIKKLVTEAKKKKVDGLVIDLSRNGGGLLDDAVKIAGLFIKKGPVVATKGFDQQVDVLADTDDGVLYLGPLLLLTSRLSASASEILAGALKDYHRALIVGSDHTYGKGTVQVVSPLPQDLGAMKVSTGMFFVPGGESTQHDGVRSDIVLPSPYATDELGEKTMDYSLPPQRISSFLGKEINGEVATQQWTPVTAEVVQKLKDLSETRVSVNKDFKEIIKNLDEAKRNKGVIKLAEIRKKAAEEEKGENKNKQASAKNRKEKIKEVQAPLLTEGLNIMADWLKMSAPHSSQLSSKN